MEIATAFVTIRPQTDGFEAELAGALGGVPDQEITLTADADTSAAVDAVESVPDGEVEVTANTEQAEAALDQVSEKVQETTESTSALGEAATGALGGMGGLGGAAGGAASGLGATAAAGAGAAAGLFAFAQSAIDAESAGQRFEMIAGTLGPELQTIDVGGLSGDIGDLALQLGSSDEAMLNATASFVTFGESTGATSDEIVSASNDINALALRAVALNPALGDAGAVAERMTNALARGGRATTAFGIGLTSAEINARAMADTGKQNATELTQFEKAAAGAAIATERLGQSMGEDFAAGSQNARTEWNRMTESLGEASEQVGSTMLPAIENITEAVTELADGIANLDLGTALAGLWDISGPGLFVNGITDAWSAVTGMGNASMQAAGNVTALPSSLIAAADSTDSFTAAADAASAAVGGLDARIQGYLTGIFNVPEAERALRDSFTALADTLGQSGSSADDVAVSLQGIVERAAALGAATGDMTGAVDATVFGLAGLQAQGKLSAAQVAEVTSQLESLPGNTEGNVSTPGAPEARSQAQAVGDALLGIPRYTRATVVVDAVTSGIDAAGRAIAGLRADASRGITVTTHTSKEKSMGKVGADVGRSGGGAIAPVTIVHQTVMPNGDVLAESMFEVDRRVAIAEGYEQ